VTQELRTFRSLDYLKYDMAFLFSHPTLQGTLTRGDASTLCKQEDLVMRDFMHLRSVLPSSLMHVEMVSRLLANLRARHVVQEISEHDDVFLHDIGLTRDDVTNATHVPINMNAVAQLEKFRKSHSDLDLDAEDVPAVHDGLEATVMRSRLSRQL
jgi:uncharacterized protein YjiS (DUF1127 family)